MTQEQKDLLLKDLCARLPYGVKVICETEKSIFEIEAITSYSCVCPKDKNYLHNIEDDEIKPCLFPLSSMTEEQYYELQNCSSDDCLEHMEILKSLRECTDFMHWPLYEYRVIDWFLKNHFDYRGLIEKGLAVDVTGLNIKIY